MNKEDTLLLFESTSPDSGVVSRSLRVRLDPKLNQYFCSTIQIVRISAINIEVSVPIRHSSDGVGRSTVRNHEVQASSRRTLSRKHAP